MGDGRVPASKLRRMLIARERDLDVLFIVRGPTANSPWRITEPLLREHCPELFDRRDELAQMLRRELDKIRDEVRELRERDRAIAQSFGSKLRALRERVDRLR